MPAAAVHVEGLRELNRAFAQFPPALKKAMREELRLMGEPVARRAEQIAVSDISHIGDRWSRMRVGSTMSLVYVAPKSRRRRGSPRPNLAPLLMDAMEASLGELAPEIVAHVDHVIGVIAGETGF